MNDRISLGGITKVSFVFHNWRMEWPDGGRGDEVPVQLPGLETTPGGSITALASLEQLLPDLEGMGFKPKDYKSGVECIGNTIRLRKRWRLEKGEFFRNRMRASSFIMEKFFERLHGGVWQVHAGFNPHNQETLTLSCFNKQALPEDYKSLRIQEHELLLA